jgi:hypothetical protein
MAADVRMGCTFANKNQIKGTVRFLEDAGEATARLCLEYRSEKNLLPKKVQKSLWKKSERARKALVNQLRIMHSFCFNYAPFLVTRKHT